MDSATLNATHTSGPPFVASPRYLPITLQPRQSRDAETLRHDGGAANQRCLRVLVACEFSGTVRDAFAARGHDAWSCDMLPSDKPGKQHFTGDVRKVLALEWEWDLMIAHPPCTFLAVSGARWFAARQQEQADALDFVRLLLDAPIARIALENPVSVISSKIRKPDQIIQPWMFGHGETKATCLWLKNLPKLRPTDIVDGREAREHHCSPGPDRWKERSRTLPGTAEAMAEQWGDSWPATLQASGTGRNETAQEDNEKISRRSESERGQHEEQTDGN